MATLINKCRITGSTAALRTRTQYNEDLKVRKLPEIEIDPYNKDDVRIEASKGDQVGNWVKGDLAELAIAEWNLANPKD